MTWDGNAVRWRGLFSSYQLPSDLWRYQELVVEHAPDWIIETGTGEGGTLRFLQDVCQLEARATRFLGIDNDSLSIGKSLRGRLDGSVMVILDSDVYNPGHMYKELVLYAPFVTVGQCLIVCHTDREDWGSRAALSKYLSENLGEFELLEDPSPTLNPGGYLRRVSVRNS